MKRRIILIYCNTIIGIYTIYLSAEKVVLPASKFASDAGDTSGLLGSYKSLADKAISISFLIAAIPVIWALATNSQKSRKALISYITSIIVYYGVISKFI